MIERIVIGDYLYYSGRFGNGLCQLDEFVENFGKRLSIRFLEDEKIITCDYSDVRLLRTQEQHILSLGFTKPDSKKEYYVHPKFKIASAGLNIQNQIFISIQISAVDNNFENVDLLSYCDGTEFNYIAYHAKYPSVYYLKDFFSILEKYDIPHDKLDLVRLIQQY